MSLLPTVKLPADIDDTPTNREVWKASQDPSTWLSREQLISRINTAATPTERRLAFQILAMRGKR